MLIDQSGVDFSVSPFLLLSQFHKGGKGEKHPGCGKGVWRR